MAGTSGAERAITVVLLVLFAAGALLAAFFGLFIGMFSDGCGSGAVCELDKIGYGVAIASLGQLVLAVVVVVVTIVRMVRSRSAWWVPLLGAVGVVGLLVVGAAVAADGVSS